MFRLSSLLAAAAFALTTVSGTLESAQANPIVATPQGQVEGRGQGDVEVFRSIPFAAPPVGALRWRPPQPASAWSGVRRHTNTRFACPQLETRLTRFAKVQEDCLYLNVWRPQAQTGAPLPVLVWIHGGAYIQGAGSNPLYDAAVPARAGLVVVTINYRLGPLGFFAHPELEAEAAAAGEASANYGLMDQIEALAWVQANIAGFGGDPNNVTIMGESAGAGSVRALMASPVAQGLFHKAIMMSGASAAEWQTPEAAIAARAPDSPLARPLAELRAADWRPIARDLLGELKAGEPVIQPPLIDGVILPEDPGFAFAAGRQARVPLMIGATSDEASLVRMFVRDIDEAVFGLLGPRAEPLRAIYDPSQAMTDKALANLWVGDYTQVEPTRRHARWHAASGAPVFHYSFDYEPERLAAQQDGAPHGAEVLFLFNTVDALPPRLRRLQTPQDVAVSNRMVEAWASFARTGQPGAGWAAFTAASEMTLLINRQGNFVPSANYRARELDAWAAFSP